MSVYDGPVQSLIDELGRLPGIGPKSDMLTLAGERGWIPMSINIVTAPTNKRHAKKP